MELPCVRYYELLSIEISNIKSNIKCFREVIWPKKKEKYTVKTVLWCLNNDCSATLRRKHFQICRYRCWHAKRFYCQVLQNGSESCPIWVRECFVNVSEMCPDVPDVSDFSPKRLQECLRNVSKMCPDVSEMYPTFSKTHSGQGHLLSERDRAGIEPQLKHWLLMGILRLCCF